MRCKYRVSNLYTDKQNLGVKSCLANSRLNRTVVLEPGVDVMLLFDKTRIDFERVVGL